MVFRVFVNDTGNVEACCWSWKCTSPASIGKFSLEYAEKTVGFDLAARCTNVDDNSS